MIALAWVFCDEEEDILVFGRGGETVGWYTIISSLGSDEDWLWRDEESWMRCRIGVG